jgi:hypothetical protein
MSIVKATEGNSRALGRRVEKKGGKEEEEISKARGPEGRSLPSNCTGGGENWQKIILK